MRQEEAKGEKSSKAEKRKEWEFLKSKFRQEEERDHGVDFLRTSCVPTSSFIGKCSLLSNK